MRPRATSSRCECEHEVVGRERERTDCAMSTVDLPEGWDKVTDDDGRVYYWNVDTDEVSWEVPKATTAKAAVAEGYVANAASAASSGGGGTARELEELRAKGGGSVADMQKRLQNASLSDSDSSSPTRTSVAEIENKSKATSVDELV